MWCFRKKASLKKHNFSSILNSYHFLIWSAVFIFCYAFPYAGSAESKKLSDNHAGFLVEVKNNLLSVNASNVPLKKMMNEIMNQTSIKITLPPEENNTLSANFNNQPLEEGLKWLMRDYDTVFIYGAVPGNPPEIQQIIIYSKNDNNSNNRPGINAPETGNHQRVFPGDMKNTHSNLPIARIDSKDLPDSKPTEREIKNPEMDSSIIPLSRIVSDQGQGDRVTAIRKLGDLGDENALVPLVMALRDTDPQVRESAMDGLSRLGGVNVIRALEGCLNDENVDVRDAAEKALRKLKN